MADQSLYEMIETARQEGYIAGLKRAKELVQRWADEEYRGDKADRELYDSLAAIDLEIERENNNSKEDHSG